jgi:16S rRNA (cytosine1402-N4)-methyltransferase
MHVPVMLNECLEYLAIRPDGIFLDATAGLGGHSGAIAQRLTTGFVIANDRDAESLELAKLNTSGWADRIRFHHGAFSELRSALAKFGIERVDGLLADLGVSRYQLTEPERGFS